MSGFSFRLYLEDGNDIGSFATSVPDWEIGDVFYNRDHVECRILDIVHSEALGGDEFAGAFIVTPPELAEPD